MAVPETVLPAAPVVRRRRRIQVGVWIPLAILLLIVIVAVIGKVAPPQDPLATHPADKLLPPGTGGHLFGTDKYGRDVLSRVMASAATDLMVAVSATVLAFGFGVLWGAIAAYWGRRVDDVIMRVVDVVLSFPSFVLALAITTVLGNSLRNVIIAISVAYCPYFIRLTRGEVLSARASDYAENARAIGNPAWRIVGLHLLPNSIGPAIVQASLTLGWAVLDVAGLAFLGLGIKPPTPEWGVDVGAGSSDMVSGQWWTSVFPGLAIFVTVFVFNLLGDALRDYFSRRRG
jgi:peptide/nickel transport system permease protein